MMPIWLGGIIGIIWVGGGGILFMRNPAFVARVFGQIQTEKSLRRIRIIAAIELGTVVIGLIFMAISAIFAPDELARFLFSN